VTATRFRFGVSARQAAGGAEWRELARRYEGEGFDILTMPDHLGDMLSPMSGLAAAAAVTTTLRIGTFVVNNDFWNPLILAREVTTLATLSDGRFELGLGAGHAAAEYEAVGIPYDRPAVRVARLAATVPILRRECPEVPILVGGNGDRLLAVAASQADIVGFVGFTSGTGTHHTDLSHFTWDGLAERVAHVRAVAGARFDDLELNVLVQSVGPPPPRLEMASPFVMTGDTAQMVDHVEHLRWLGVTYLVAFHERGAGDLAPVIAALS
jgi:probable F420-dependent oxidoreductase